MAQHATAPPSATLRPVSPRPVPYCRRPLRRALLPWPNSAALPSEVVAGAARPGAIVGDGRVARLDSKKDRQRLASDAISIGSQGKWVSMSNLI